MTIRFVTTCHKAGFEEYGKRLLDGFHNLPQTAELWWYTEGYNIPPAERIKTVDNATLEDLQSFKKRYGGYVPPYYTMDVVRFSHKIFSVVDALADHDDLGVWFDADIVPYAPMSEQYVRSMLPEGHYIALFRRNGMYSECGFWIVDCRHKGHRKFMSALLDMYVTDAFRDAAEWHDSYLMDVVLRNFEKDGYIKSHNLSGEHADQEHPMAYADIAKYVDHLKGERKAEGASKENAFR